MIRELLHPGTWLELAALSLFVTAAALILP